MRKIQKKWIGILSLALLLLMGMTAHAEEYRETVNVPNFAKTVTVTPAATPAQSYAAIQKALDDVSGASRSSTGRVILQGDFKIDNILHVHSNTYIDATNATITKVYGGASTGSDLLYNTRLGAANDSAGRYDLNENIWVVGGVWSGGDVKASTTPGTNFCFVHAKGVYILNATVKNSYAGHMIELNAVQDALVQGCTFNGFIEGKESYDKNKLAIQIDMAHGLCGRYNEPEHVGCESHSSMPESYLPDDTTCDNIRVIANTFNSAQECGYYVCAVGTNKTLTRDTKANPNGIYHTNIKILGNTIQNCSQPGRSGSVVSIKGIDTFEVKGNTISNVSGIGITVYRSKNGTVAQNIISGCNENGILMNSDLKDVKVTGNNITNSGQMGFSCNADGDGTMSGISVTGNTIDKAQTLIYISKGANIAEVSGNTLKNATVPIKNNTNYGISVNEAVVETIANNSIDTSTYAGIGATQSGRVTTVSGNTIGNVQYGILAMPGVNTGSYTSQIQNITGNTVKGAGVYGLWLKSSLKTESIHSNSVDGSGSTGLYVDNSEIGTIDANSFQNGGKYGLYFTGAGSKVSLINGNTISGNTTVGINIVKGASLQTVSQNKIQNNKKYGIYLADSGSKITSVTGNTISGNTSAGIFVNSGTVIQTVSGNTLSGNGKKDFAVTAGGRITNNKDEKTTATKPATKPTPQVTSVKANIARATIGVGEKLQLAVTVKPASLKKKAGLTYTSSKKTVATVTSTGKITGKKAGTTIITIKSKNGKVARVTVTVKKAPTSVSILKGTKAIKTLTLKKGQYLYLKTKLAKTGAASYKMTWKSSNSKVLTVTSTGKITAKKKGTATITVYTYNYKKATLKVTVK